MRHLGLLVAEHEKKCTILEGDLKIEREWRKSLEDHSVRDAEEKANLRAEIATLEQVAQVLPLISC